MSEYANLLRSPLWQQKRLEILKLYDFQCEECGNKEQELHVHHRHYEKGKKPWEYEDAVYSVLCKTCHDHRHHYDALLRKEIGMLYTETLVRLLDVVSVFGNNQGLYLIATGVVHGVEWAYRSSPDGVVENLKRRANLTKDASTPIPEPAAASHGGPE